MEYLQLQISQGATDEEINAVGGLLSLVTAMSDTSNPCTLLFPENGNNTFYLCGEDIPQELVDFLKVWCDDGIDIYEMPPALVVKFWKVSFLDDTPYLIATLPDDDCWLDCDADRLAAQVAGYSPGEEQEYLDSLDPTEPRFYVEPMTIHEVVAFLHDHPEDATETAVVIDGVAWSFQQVVDAYDCT